MNRRELLKGVAFGATALLVRPTLAGSRDTAARLTELERKHGGRLGAAVLDTANGRRAAHRGNERFLMCSTFKLLLVAAVLARVDQGKEREDRRVVFDNSALLEWAPVTRGHVGAHGMTIAGLCKAAITLSDNTAANLLLASLGGPAAVTAYARSLGDSLTRLDRTEPELNRPDGDKDTTTPWAMLGDMQKLLLGDALSRASRDQLIQWLLDCQTGADSVRAGLPANWREGDKTGSGHTANNDVVIAWPPKRKPLLIAAYYDNAHAGVAARKAVLAEVGRIVATV